MIFPETKYMNLSEDLHLGTANSSEILPSF